jgi:hypothetical protein
MDSVPICWNTLLQWCVDTYYIRQITDAILRARSRYLLGRFEQQRPAHAQANTLAGLVHRAQSTRFGRDHDFRRIRTVADFRRLVPLRTAAELERLHGQATRPFPWAAPAHVDGTRQALKLALAFVIAARPSARLLTGCTLILGEDLPLCTEEGEGGLSLRPARGVLGLPRLLRPYALLAREATSEVAVHAARLPLTCLVGSPYQIANLFERAREMSGRDRVTDIWPRLAAVLPTRPLSAALRSQLREDAGPNPVVLEMCVRPEAVLAIEDPRYDSPRLLHHQGLFLEFVPADEADHPHAARLGFDEVTTDVVYEVAVTTAAGMWACRAGCSVVFKRLDPPLVSFVETRRPLPRRTDLVAVTSPTQLPHPQSAGTGAARPGTIVHSPWSASADQE